MTKLKTVLLVVFGKSGSGKDYLTDYLTTKSPHKKLFNRIVRTTSRPKREGETNGVEYDFIDETPLETKDYLEHNVFNGWFYGTPKSSLHKIKINIMPGSIETYENLKAEFQENEEYEVIGVRLDLSDKLRLLRSLGREHDPNIVYIAQRILDEEKQYKGKEDVYDFLIPSNESATIIERKLFELLEDVVQLEVRRKFVREVDGF